MKVLQVTHYMPPHEGGIERVAASLHEGLRKRGLEMSWAASDAGGAAGDEGALVRLRSENVLETRAGVPIPLPHPSALRALAARVLATDVLVVHDCIYPTNAFAATVARRAGIPTLLIQHVGYVAYGPVLDRVQRLAYHSVGRLTLAMATERVSVSPHVAAYLAAEGLPADFEWVCNGIDDARFRPARHELRTDERAKLGIGADERIALFAGRLVEKKGVRRVAESLAGFRSHGWRVVIAGDGPLASLFDGSDALRLGRIEPAAMPSVYALGDVLVLPSHGEGFPLTVQEARMCGLGTVVSDDPSYLANLPSAVAHRLCTERESLADACASLAMQTLDREAIAADARARWSMKAFLDSYEQRLRRMGGESR